MKKLKMAEQISLISRLTRLGYIGHEEKSKIIILNRCNKKRFRTRTFIHRTIESAVIITLLLTGFAGVGALACCGLEIIELNTNPQIIISSWHYHKNACLGGMLVSFSTFLGSFLLGASLSISRDNFHK